MAAASNAGRGMEDPGPSDDQHQRQEQKMQAVGRMAGGVVHDFANIITIIAGYSAILLGRLDEDDPSRAELKEIRRAAERGAQLAGQILGFARGQDIEPQPVDLCTLVLEVQELIRPLIGEHIEIELALAPDLGRIMADPVQMQQVVMNLMLNARDAMPKGGLIRVETSEREIGPVLARQHSIHPGQYVELSISDAGHGIDSESMQRLFEPFFTTKDKGKGTGLGLSTVREIVTANRGAVWATSASGAGATFVVCLPRIRMAPIPLDNVSESGASPAPVQPCAETILLVEDEESVRRLLGYILRNRGYQVIDASSGDEALAIFAECGDSVHLLLTDMVMPKMSGRELSERLRQIRPDLKVVYMSGYTDEVLVRTGALGPGMSFLQKPLRPEALTATVRAALDSPPVPFDPR